MSVTEIKPEITEWLEDDILHISLDMQEQADNYEYAFYLVFDSETNTSKKVIWYQFEPEVTFKLEQSGTYYTVSFVRKKGCTDSSIYESEKKFSYIAAAHNHFNNIEKVASKCGTVSIFGSCVSRDVLANQTPGKESLTLKTYIARQSIISSVSTPISFSENEILLDSAFQKRMVFADLRKDAFLQLQETQSDYLIIDLIDERFDLIEFEGSYATLSNEAVESKFFQNRLGIETQNLCRIKKKAGLIQHNVQGVAIDTFVKKFADKLKEIYPESHIIIHEAYMHDYYKAKDGTIKKFPVNYLMYNKSINNQLEAMYACLKDCLPGAHVFNVNEGMCAYEQHKWGLAPMHYVDEYYKCALFEIEQIICRQNKKDSECGVTV